MGLMTAVVMLIFVSLAVSSLALLFAGEAQRTRSASAGGQLRELLLAAPPVALEELRRGGASARDVTVPTPVVGATLTLQIRPDASGATEIRVVARGQSGVAVQTLRYGRDGEGWKLRSATLGIQP
jgi:hypothetical protein